MSPLAQAALDLHRRGVRLSGLLVAEGRLWVMVAGMPCQAIHPNVLQFGAMIANGRARG